MFFICCFFFVRYSRFGICIYRSSAACNFTINIAVKKGFFYIAAYETHKSSVIRFFFSRLHVRQSSAEKKVKGDSMQSTMKLHNFLFNFTIQFIQIKLPVTVAITNAASVTATLKRNAHYIFSFRFSNLQFSQTSSM